MAYRVLLFDLFGTLVHFKPRLPTARDRSDTNWLEWLRDESEAQLPGLPFDRLVEAVAAVSEEIYRARPPEFFEVESRERFRRALERLGVTGDLNALAGGLSERHMSHLAAQTTMPAQHRLLLEELRDSYLLGLISNFDHGPTARRVLRDHGIDGLLPVTLISAEHGRRKPHPGIFHDALRQLGAEASEALYIGDTPADDIRGARAAGMDAAWIDRKGHGAAADEPAPTFVLRELAQLRSVLS